MKKKLFGVLCMVVLLFAFGTIAYAADTVASGTCGDDLTWVLDSDGVLTISGTGDMEDYSSASYPPWYSQKTAIRNVVMEIGVTSLGSSAFSGCSNLSSAILPGTLTEIGRGAFLECYSLTSITIPAGVTNIERNAFWACRSLTSVSIPDSVTTIAPYAFSYCDGLTEVYLPKYLTNIGEFAFEGCSSLMSIDLPDSLRSIDTQAFSWCTSLTSVEIPAGVTNIGAGAFAICTSLTSVKISAGVTSVDGWAFQNCSNLTKIEIPASVTNIGAFAFNNCTDLREICFLGNAPTIYESDSDASFTNVTATCYYPLGNETWSEDIMRDYGGCLTWVGYQPEASLIRISGKGRCETAIKAADTLKETLGVDEFDSIIIASGNNFADALAGSYLAAKKNAPILLYQSSSVELNKSYILENLKSMKAGGTVYLLGGTAAVPADIETILRTYGVNVVRLSGKTRFETNLKILEEAGVEQGQEILVCTGYNFADSLSASATGLPILMVDSNKNVLTDAQKKFLSGLEGSDITIIGGTGAVGTELAYQLKSYGTVTRLSGKTRYETSTLIAKTYFEDVSTVVIAYGNNFPDGLCGGPLAYAMGAPLVLTAAKSETAAAEYVANNPIANGYILGGTAALSDDTVNIIFGVE